MARRKTQLDPDIVAAQEHARKKRAAAEAEAEQFRREAIEERVRACNAEHAQVVAWAVAVAGGKDHVTEAQWRELMEWHAVELRACYDRPKREAKPRWMRNAEPDDTDDDVIEDVVVPEPIGAAAPD